MDNVNNGKSLVQKKTVPEQVGTYVVGLSEELKKVYPYKLDGKCQPELIVGRSEILDIKDVLNISTQILGETNKLAHTLKILNKTSWSLAYSTSLHTRSLHGLYNKLQGFYENGIHHLLIMIKDKEKNLFGTFVATKLNCSYEKYTAELSVLFHCNPTFEIIGENQCTITCREDYLEIADSDGKYGISLHEHLQSGKLEQCAKINTKIDGTNSEAIYTSTKSKSFQIKTLECWIFGSQ